MTSAGGVEAGGALAAAASPAGIASPDAGVVAGVPAAGSVVGGVVAGVGSVAGDGGSALAAGASVGVTGGSTALSTTTTPSASAVSTAWADVPSEKPSARVAATAATHRAQREAQPAARRGLVDDDAGRPPTRPTAGERNDARVEHDEREDDVHVGPLLGQNAQSRTCGLPLPQRLHGLAEMLREEIVASSGSDSRPGGGRSFQAGPEIGHAGVDAGGHRRRCR